MPSLVRRLPFPVYRVPIADIRSATSCYDYGFKLNGKLKVQLERRAYMLQPSV